MIRIIQIYKTTVNASHILLGNIHHQILHLYLASSLNLTLNSTHVVKKHLHLKYSVN